jgi:hypothetical protein
MNNKIGILARDGQFRYALFSTLVSKLSIAHQNADLVVHSCTQISPPDAAPQSQPWRSRPQKIENSRNKKLVTPSLRLLA